MARPCFLSVALSVSVVKMFDDPERGVRFGQLFVKPQRLRHTALALGNPSFGASEL